MPERWRGVLCHPGKQTPNALRLPIKPGPFHENVDQLPGSGNGHFDSAAPGIVHEIWILDHQLLAKIGVGEMHRLRSDSGVQRYRDQIATYRRSVANEEIYPSRLFNARTRAAKSSPNLIPSDIPLRYIGRVR